MQWRGKQKKPHGMSCPQGIRLNWFMWFVLCVFKKQQRFSKYSSVRAGIYPGGMEYRALVCADTEEVWSWKVLGVNSRVGLEAEVSYKHAPVPGHLSPFSLKE